MKEIGSEFWTTVQNGEGISPLFSSQSGIRFTLCGRNALEMIVEDILFCRQVKSVFMPSYCCHTMIEPFLRHGIRTVFYDVFPTCDGIECDYRENDCDIVFLIDYFGFINPATATFAEDERRKGKIIVYDRTHALFAEDSFHCADYTLGSFRKWFGVNAGYAQKEKPWDVTEKQTQNTAYTEMRNRAFDLKAQYIEKEDAVPKDSFLRLFSEAEEMLEKDCTIYTPDLRSSGTLDSIDVVTIREQRRINASFLIHELSRLDNFLLPIKHVRSGDCPLFVPICSKDRNGLRRHLIDNRIYCPAHWPISDLHQLNDRSRVLYEQECSVICDQRYGLQDMERIVFEIKRYFKTH